MKDNRAVTYSLLAHIRNTGTLIKGPIDVFVPLIKRSLHILNKKGVFKGKSILEIQTISNDLYSIDFPIPVLKTILHKIALDVNINGDNNFQMFNDNSFILKDFYFEDFEDKIQESIRDVETIEKLFIDFAKVNNIDLNETNSVIKFIEKNKVSISKYISNYQFKNGFDYTVEARFIDFFKQIPNVYEIIRRIYLGSIITSFLEFKSEKLNNNVELLFDTNFIISLMDLNTPESTHTCNKLLEVCKNLGYKFTILSDTIEEIKFLLTKKAENFSNTFLGKKINPEDIYNACDRRNLNRNDIERIVDNIEDTIIKHGIFIIPHTEPIRNKAKLSKEYELFKEMRNSKTSALHDATAIYYVREKRGKRIKEFEKVNCWFVNNSISHNSEQIGDNYQIEFQNEIIRADELLNILWLSNPSINNKIENDDLIDIGLTSIVAFTLNDSLPKSSIIKELDDNIQKYRDETISDKDIILISTRISNRQLKDISSLNSLANNDKEEFVRKLKDEASKQEIEEKQRIEKLEKLFEKFEKQISSLDKAKVKIKNDKVSLDSERERLKSENSDNLKSLNEEKIKRINSENKLKKIEREKFIKKKVSKWRSWIYLLLLFSIVFFITSLSISLTKNNYEITSSLRETIKFESSDNYAIIFMSLSSTLFIVFIAFYGIRFLNNSVVEAYKKTIE
ncbi:MAG: hypothetical protein Q8K02_03150, partial [Flavobacterium sp.]|nr:hypothetical protein [Flavobacterium sp.]